MFHKKTFGNDYCSYKKIHIAVSSLFHLTIQFETIPWIFAAKRALLNESTKGYSCPVFSFLAEREFERTMPGGLIIKGIRLFI
jgi:hypothetical protein